jgi:acetolactate synthase-1/2/3 large subunit
MINKHSKGDAIMVSDVQHQMFTCRYANSKVMLLWRIRNDGICITSSCAKMGMPNREVVAVIGDGGFQMTIQELGTIFQTKVPVKRYLTMSFLGMVRQCNRSFF